MTAVAETDVVRDRPAWLEWRRDGIGGSDAAAVCGMDPRKGPMAVWLEKVGAVRDEEESPALRRGRRFEPVIIEMFEEETGLKVVRQQELVVHPERLWQRATLDGRVVDGARPGRPPIEIKSVHWRWAEEWREGVPEHYLLQIQHQLAASGAEVAIAAALIGLDDLRTFVVERDEKTIEQLTAIEEWFWGLVLAGTPPAVDGSDGTGEALNRAWPRPMRKTVELPPHALALRRQRDAADAEIKAAKERLREAENELKALLKDAEVGTVDERPIVRWTRVVQHRVDVDWFRRRLPRLVGRHMKETSFRRFSFPRLEER